MKGNIIATGVVGPTGPSPRNHPPTPFESHADALAWEYNHPPRMFDGLGWLLTGFGQQFIDKLGQSWTAKEIESFVKTGAFTTYRTS